MLKFIRNLDGFGVPINLAFKAHSGSYKTLFGSVVTVIFSLALFATFVKSFERMWWVRNPNISTFTDS